MRRTVLAVLLPLLLVPQTAAAPRPPRWVAFNFSQHGHSCTGPVRTQTAKLKLPPIGQVYGAKHNPPCGEAKEAKYILFITDGDIPFKVDIDPGDPKASCKDLVLTIPPNVHLCELRFFASEADGDGWTEEVALRNLPRHRTFSWARKGRTQARVLRDGTLEIKAEMKNWKRSDPRYFGFEYDVQLADRRVR